MASRAAGATLTEPSVFVFGNNVDGNAGIKSADEQIATPASMHALVDGSIEDAIFARIVGNQHVTFVITTDGTLLTAGANDNHELGRAGKRSLLSRVDALEAYRVTDVALGDGFALLALQDGRTVSWGKNDMGQLGLGSGHREDAQKPKLASILSEAGGLVQVGAGAHHCVALARSGGLYTWGANRRGQLGDGFLNSCASPQILPQLRHRPVIEISCGEAHTLARTVGGNVYCWGDNAQGQLGLQDTKTRLRPELIRSLRASRVVAIAAGRQHSMAIAPSGLLFAWGANYSGQLGISHATSDTNTPKYIETPTVVEKLRPGEREGDTPVEVSCGSAHSMVLLENGAVYSFGLGSSGQLGLGHRNTVYVPCAVQLPAGYRAIGVSCGGPLSMTSWIYSEGIRLARVPLPVVDLNSLRNACRKLRENPGQLAALNPLRQMVAQAFSSISVLNASFRSPHGGDASGAFSGGGLCVQLHEVRAAYTCLIDTQHELVLNTLSRALLQMTESLREVPTDDPENLSVFLIALENPLLLNASQMYVALERIVSGILALPRQSRQQLFGWLRSYPSEFFARVVLVIQGYLSYGLTSKANDIDAAPAVLVLQSLWEINGGCVHSDGSIPSYSKRCVGYSSRPRIIPDSYFVNDSLQSQVNLLEERQKFLQARREHLNTKVFNYLDYPFLLNVTVKAEFLKQDFLYKKQLVAFRVCGALNMCTSAHAARGRSALGRGEGRRVMYDTLTRQVNLSASSLPCGLKINLPETFAGYSAASYSPDSVPISVPYGALALEISVRREHLLQDVLKRLYSVCNSEWGDSAASASSHHMDVLFLPLNAAFQGEEGIDAGGVSKEMLTLAVQQMLSTYGVLRPMANGRLVWFRHSDYTNKSRVMQTQTASLRAVHDQNRDRDHGTQGTGLSSGSMEIDVEPEAAAWKEGLPHLTPTAPESGKRATLREAKAEIDCLFDSHSLANSPPSGSGHKKARESGGDMEVQEGEEEEGAGAGARGRRKLSRQNSLESAGSDSAATAAASQTRPAAAVAAAAAAPAPAELPSFPYNFSQFFYPVQPAVFGPAPPAPDLTQRRGSSNGAGADGDSTDLSGSSYDYEAEFALGLLYGFASYHGCLIDLPLPTSLFKLLMKLDSISRSSNTSSSDSNSSSSSNGAAYGLDRQPDLDGILTISDLWECDAGLANGMQQLLEFENGGSIPEVFGVTFVASENPLDPLAPPGSVELVSGGSEKLVDAANRQLFVDLYLKHALYNCVSHAALAFLRGLQVFFFCTKPAIYNSLELRAGVPLVSSFQYHLCSAQDLEEMLCGSHEVGDVSLLRLGSIYKGEFHDEHQIIHWLWDVLSELPTISLRRFLMFVTGSDRVPVGGLENVHMVVQSTRPHSGDDALPASHTCFNILDLPATYASKDQLRARLMLALEHATGFGLV